MDAVADFNEALSGRAFVTVLADPPWQFINGPARLRLSIGGLPADLEYVLA